MHLLKTSNSSRGFRHDINGLRAWAVVAVVLYHFGVVGFKGGFVGVDVFFVISGFLMTGIVVRGLESPQGFSVAAFYLARAKRILPALIALCAALLALGWWVLLPLEYQMLATHSVSSLTFLSNFMFWSEAGYFDIASHEKWLLHTWSLAVEWQFYMLLPLVLMLVWRFKPGRTALTFAIWGGFFSSFALCVAVTQYWPGSAFYLLPTRAWEMLAGGMVFLMRGARVLTGRRRALVETAGFGLIISAVVMFDASSSWPGWRAMVPVFGAALVLIAECENSRWTSHPVAQWLGTRSYSLYLWHWPVVVALVYLEMQADVSSIVIGMALTLVLGDLSFRWVEKPALLKLGKLQIGRSGAALGSVAMVVATLAMIVIYKSGVPQRIPDNVATVAAEARNGNPRGPACAMKGTGVVSPSCKYGSENLNGILLGDSHGDAVITAFATAANASNASVLQLTYQGCPFLEGVSPSPEFSVGNIKGYGCSKFVEWAIQNLHELPRNIPIVLINRTTYFAVGGTEELMRSRQNRPLVYFSERYSSATPEFRSEFSEKVISTVCRLTKDHPVFLVRPIPEMDKDVPKTVARAMLWGKGELVQDVSISLAQYHQRHAFIWKAQDAARERCGVKILDPLPYLCTKDRCHGTLNGRPLYFDDNHLSEFGNKLLVPMFAEVFTQQTRSR
jgi:peptidoglycan/LPS O-acetylase OafA/YrhL